MNSEPAVIRDDADIPDCGHADKNAAPWLALSCCLIAVAVQMVDMTIVNIALPSLGTDLGASSGQQLLVLTAYTLAFACTLLTASRIGERIGRRRVFIAALAGFTAISVLCGLAQGPTELIALRALQGGFAALASAQTIAIISASFPKSRHGIVFGIYGATAGVAAMLGPTLGGLLISADAFGLGWRTIFLVNLPLGILACAVGYRHLPALSSTSRPDLDATGIALSSAGLFLLIYPLATGRENGWPTWQLAMVASSIALLALFALHEYRLAARGGDPLLKPELFRIRSFAIGSVLSLLFFSVFAAFFFTVSVTAQFGLGFSPLRTGLLTLPFALGAAVGSLISPLMVGWIGPRTLSVGAVAFTGSLIYTALIVEPSTGIDIPTIIAPLIIGGFGMGLFVAPLQATMLSGTSERNVGSASGTVPTIQQIGASVGLAVISLLFFNQVAAESDSAVSAARESLTRDIANTKVAEPLRPFVINEFTRCASAQLGSPRPDAPGPGCPDTRAPADRAANSASPEDVRESVTADAEPALRPAARQAASQTFLAAFDVILWVLAGITITLGALTFGLRRRASPAMSTAAMSTAADISDSALR
ncbi:MFS transporter [Gordonia rubripertincta]|uniref:MFS transporter n=1 Tax=Gordonia rubripertincta TaxID=36822 RepID=A0ABT4MTJ9_GORRU|nr:MFS transporter [Gordonia rubripertincta]MCZ4550335.1 MFS transporter [Gordonia rubripertincta]